MTIAAVLTALMKIPALVSTIESFVNAVVSFYIQTQTNATLSAISDAIALTTAATTDEQRFAAMAALQKSLSSSRIING